MNDHYLHHICQNNPAALPAEFQNAENPHILVLPPIRIYVPLCQLVPRLQENTINQLFQEQFGPSCALVPISYFLLKATFSTLNKSSKIKILTGSFSMFLKSP